MIILDEPYASVPLLDWMEASAHPVLANGFTEKLVAGGRTLNLVDADECARRLEAGERIYTNSENALAWILDHVDNPTLTDAIRLFKDKAAMREKLAPLSPGLFHKTVDRAGLEAVNVADLPLPVVLKPAVGFCSMGVYVIEEPEDWAAAVADIARREDGWHERYPESVVGGSEYLIEGYLAGTEYALDAYFDEDGAPHILNILRHDFAGPEETSDRMYLTDGTIVDAWNDRFTAWLAAVNEVVGARSIPVHVELRVDGDTIAPIEFNPLRFAGLGGTDVSWYAYGYRTYEAFLEGVQPDFGAAFAGKEDKVYSMSLLNAPAGAKGNERFDYDALRSRFSHVLELRPFDVGRVGNYGFLFLETDAETAGELDFLKNTDLKEFLR